MYSWPSISIYLMWICYANSTFYIAFNIAYQLQKTKKKWKSFFHKKTVSLELIENPTKKSTTLHI